MLPVGVWEPRPLWWNFDAFMLQSSHHGPPRRLSTTSTFILKQRNRMGMETCEKDGPSVLTYFQHSDRDSDWQNLLFSQITSRWNLHIKAIPETHCSAKADLTVRPGLEFGGCQLTETLCSFLFSFRDSQNGNQLWGASHPEGLPAEVHERVRPHILRGFLQGTVSPLHLLPPTSFPAF